MDAESLIVPIKAMEEQGLTIEYFDDYDTSGISVTYGDEIKYLGTDIQIGDTIPLDSEINVPEGAIAEFSSVGRKVTAADYSGSLKDSLSVMNEVLQSELFQEKMTKQKLVGAGMMVGGGAVVLGSLAYGAALAPETTGASAYSAAFGVKFGMTVFAYGLQRATGNAHQSVYDDIRSIIVPPEAELARLKRTADE